MHWESLTSTPKLWHLFSELSIPFPRRRSVTGLNKWELLSILYAGTVTSVILGRLVAAQVPAFVRLFSSILTSFHTRPHQDWMKHARAKAQRASSKKIWVGSIRLLLQAKYETWRFWWPLEILAQIKPEDVIEFLICQCVFLVSPIALFSALFPPIYLYLWNHNPKTRFKCLMVLCPIFILCCCVFVFRIWPNVPIVPICMPICLYPIPILSSRVTRSCAHCLCVSLTSFTCYIWRICKYGARFACWDAIGELICLIVRLRSSMLRRKCRGLKVNLQNQSCIAIDFLSRSIYICTDVCPSCYAVIDHSVIP